MKNVLGILVVVFGAFGHFALADDQVVCGYGNFATSPSYSNKLSAIEMARVDLNKKLKDVKGSVSQLQVTATENGTSICVIVQE